MDAWTFALLTLVLLVVLVLGTLALRLLFAHAALKTAKAQEKAAVARKMAALAKRSAIVRRKRKEPEPDDEDEDDDEEDEGDDIDQFFDLVDSNPLVGGIAQGYAKQHGLDLEAVRRRDPAALAKAQQVLQAVNGQGQQAAPQGAAYL